MTPRTPRFFLLASCAAAGALAGCGGGGAGGGFVSPPAPTPLALVGPAADVTVPRGGLFDVTYVPPTLPPAGKVVLELDDDADLLTGTAAVARRDSLDLDGAGPVTVLAGADDALGTGDYALFAVDRTDDPPLLAAAATGRVRVEDRNAVRALGLREVHAVAVLADGSLAVAGSFQGSTTLAAGTPEATTYAADAGDREIVVAHVAADGRLLASWHLDTGVYGAVGGIAGTPDGGFLVAGVFTQSLGIPSPPPLLIELPAFTSQDAFVVRVDPQGRMFLVARTGGAIATVEGLATASDGRALVVGGQYGTLSWFDLRREVVLDALTAGADGYALALDADGYAVWHRRVGAAGGVRTGGSAATADGGWAFAATYLGIVASDDDLPGGFAVAGDPTAREALLLRLDADGAIVEGAVLDATGDLEATDVAAAPDGSVAVVGWCEGGMVFAGEAAPEPGQYGSRVWAARLERDGTLRWARAAYNETSRYEAAVTVLRDGTVVMAGMAEEPLHVVGSNGARDLPMPGGPLDGFVAAWRDDGELRFATLFGGAGTEVLLDVAAAPDGTLHLGGLSDGQSYLFAGEAFPLPGPLLSAQTGVLVTLNPAGR